MKVYWAVDDGLDGPAKSHVVEIPDRELEGLDEEGIQDVIREFVDDDFRQKVSWYIVKVETSG